MVRAAQYLRFSAKTIAQNSDGWHSFRDAPSGPIYEGWDFRGRNPDVELPEVRFLLLFRANVAE
jgi:hypothetical protein